MRTKSRHSRDPARAKHVRCGKAQIRTTRANYYGCNSQAAERNKTARLASPLGIPLGASTGATQRPQTLLPKHTVSTRQTRLRLLWPCQPGVFASRSPTRFSYSFLPSRLARDPARAKRISPERSATSTPPCDSEKNRDARESTLDATHRRLKGPKRPGPLASSGSRSGRLRVPREGALAGKLKTFRIPLGRMPRTGMRERKRKRTWASAQAKQASRIRSG